MKYFEFVDQSTWPATVTTINGVDIVDAKLRYTARTAKDPMDCLIYIHIKELLHEPVHVQNLEN